MSDASDEMEEAEEYSNLNTSKEFLADDSGSDLNTSKEFIADSELQEQLGEKEESDSDEEEKNYGVGDSIGEEATFSEFEIFANR